MPLSIAAASPLAAGDWDEREKSLAKLAARRREYSVKEQDALQVATEDRISADIHAIDGTTLKQEQERTTPLRPPKSSNWPH